MGFDAVQFDLKTLSLHNYEFENLKVRNFSDNIFIYRFVSFVWMFILLTAIHRHSCGIPSHSPPQSGRTQFSHRPIIRVDPLQRCAVVLLYDRHLAVLPFRRSEALATGGKYISKPLTHPSAAVRSGLSWERRATAPLLATFTTCLSTSTGEKINNVVDMQFLHGYFEPTLLVLYEPIGTWAG